MALRALETPSARLDLAKRPGWASVVPPMSNTITWHTEHCDDPRCHGGCHQTALTCDDCGETHIFEDGQEEAAVGTPCEDPECDGVLGYPDSYVDEGLAERRQMGLTAL